MSTKPSLSNLVDGESQGVLLRRDESLLAVLQQTSLKEILGIKSADYQQNDYRLVTSSNMPAAVRVNLRQLGFSYYDHSNKEIFLKGPDYLILICTTQALAEPKKRKAKGTFGTIAKRNVFTTLVTNPELMQATVREVSKLAGVSPAAVSNALNANRDEYATLRRLRQPDKIYQNNDTLLKATNIIIELAQAILSLDTKERTKGRFKLPNFQNFEIGYNEGYSGRYGASILGADLIESSAILYTRAPIMEAMLKHKLVPDKDGQLEIKEPFWPETLTNHQNKLATPTVVIIADLLALDDSRATQAAYRLAETLVNQLKK